MRLSRRALLGILAVAVVGSSGAGAYVRMNGDRAAAEPELDLPDVSAGEQFSTDIAVAVEAAPAVRDTLVLTVSAAGQAASWRQTAVRAQVAGQVRAVRVAENSRVGQGTVLIEIDPTEYRLALEEAEARLRQAQGQYREITLGDDRIEDARLRAERDSAARARSGLDGAQVAVTRAEINLERTRVTAPFAGTVANLRVVPGQFVSQGEELLTVQAMDPIKVEAQVLEGEIGFLAQGRTAQVTFAAFPGEVFEGTIESINSCVASETLLGESVKSARNGGLSPRILVRLSSRFDSTVA